ncbi:MAG TPA: hypothetical protein VGQ93_00050 [Lysobacter sp.]|nr:hypothetical protein [Lysobacter sp.]
MAPFDYTTSSNVFSFGNSAGTNTDPVNEGTVMTGLVTAMSRAIDTYCNQVFYEQDYSNQVLRAQVDEEGVLTCYPRVPTMSAPNAAAWRQARSSTWIDLTASALDVEDNTFGCVVRVLNSTYLAYRGARLQMRLTYSGGYASLQDMPSDFEWAMRGLCWWAYQKRSAPQDRTAIPDLGVLIIPGNWPPYIKAMFRSYVRQIVM